MLYNKNNTQKLSKELFDNPTSEYRGTPFWALNNKLDKDQLCRQIDCFNEMGLGGFHMHPRTGLDTPYLSDEFMENISACVQKAKENKMLAWMYDEDRWPSGFAGGLLTKDPKYRARNLLFTPYKYGEYNLGGSTNDASARSSRSENGELIGTYEVVLNDDGTLKSYSLIKDDTLAANGTTWYAYVETPTPNPWYNNQTYVNTLDKEAMDEFIKITYERYKEVVGDEFGKTIPAMFTDEPQFSHKITLGFAHEMADIMLPWTNSLPQSFKESYNSDLLEKLPELFWDLSDGKVSQTRYFYHDHVCELFTKAFADNCGKWCRENDVLLTGHMMEEPTLQSQTAALGEAMRSYRGFGLPGIDMLCDSTEFTTAKQAQSATHQFGYEGVLSELYGVTNWDFDFRGHKFQGDWQAALGVTVRVQHLSWVSMAGEAKRDYPASMNYQSPWHKHYPYVEDHFARLNTALTRGKPIVKVGVIHPVESYWLYWGPRESTAAIRGQLDDNFQNLTNWLLFGCQDFDFISESLLPIQCENATSPLNVGQMNYDVVIVPDCHTLRSSTLKRLQDFKNAGGKLIFMGECPRFVDAVESDAVKELYNKSIQIEFNQNILSETLKVDQEVSIKNADGTATNNLMYNYRQDNDNRFLFIASGKKPAYQDRVEAQNITIKIKGKFIPTLMDTISGKEKSVSFEIKGDNTFVYITKYLLDSILLSLVPTNEAVNSAFKPCNKGTAKKVVDFKSKVSYKRAEPNVYLLDMAKYSLDGGAFEEEEELLRLDDKLRAVCGYPSRVMAVAQPWVIEKRDIEHYVTLRFTVNSDICVASPKLALEDAKDAVITVNGAEVCVNVDGYFTDESIKTVAIPNLVKGENIIEVKLPYAEHRNIEWCYILGEFNVIVEGAVKTIVEATNTISFGDITRQGLPFYGGNIEYCVEFDVQDDDSDIQINTTYYRGTAIEVVLDNNAPQMIAYSPYTLDFAGLGKGKHTIRLTLLGNRYNSFGALHNCDLLASWHGPNGWRTDGAAWSYEYNLKPTGILKSPEIKIY